MFVQCTSVKANQVYTVSSYLFKRRRRRQEEESRKGRVRGRKREEGKGRKKEKDKGREKREREEEGEGERERKRTMNRGKQNEKFVVYDTPGSIVWREMNIPKPVKSRSLQTLTTTG